jgi:tRNA threonylcarbamoyladenosine biosynthesis protein TsaE
MKTFHLKSEEQLNEVSKYLHENKNKFPGVWLFYGEMGAGKTTLIKNICRQFSVTDNVSSPTFSLVNEYNTENGQTIYHFDFYRIDDEEEAINIGFDEYIYSGNLCLIEWPEKIPNLLPLSNLCIIFKINSDNTRTIIVKSDDNTR